MHEEFALSSRLSNRDLHVRLSGAFEESASESLRELLNEMYTGQGRLFLDVRELEPLEADQQVLFRTCLPDLPPKQLYFKGQNGFAIGINGSRVLIMKKTKCSCTGKCKQCACARRLESRQAGENAAAHA